MEGYPKKDANKANGKGSVKVTCCGCASALSTGRKRERQDFILRPFQTNKVCALSQQQLFNLYNAKLNELMVQVVCCVCFLVFIFNPLASGPLDVNKVKCQVL